MSRLASWWKWPRRLNACCSCCKYDGQYATCSNLWFLWVHKVDLVLEGKGATKGQGTVWPLQWRASTSTSIIMNMSYNSITKETFLSNFRHSYYLLGWPDDLVAKSLVFMSLLRGKGAAWYQVIRQASLYWDKQVQNTWSSQVRKAAMLAYSWGPRLSLCLIDLLITPSAYFAFARSFDYGGVANNTKKQSPLGRCPVWCIKTVVLMFRMNIAQAQPKRHSIYKEQDKTKKVCLDLFRD